MTDFTEAAYSAAALLNIPLPVEVIPKRFASLRASAEIKDQRIVLKLSEGYAAAGREAVVGLCLDLFGRLFRKPVPDNAYTQAYRRFRKSQGSSALNSQLARAHGRRRNLSAQGTWHDLNDMVLRLVHEYPLLQELPVPRIGWNNKGGFRILGFYDESRHEILINRNLDQKRVPPFVLEYVVFHELLHAKHPVKHGRSRRTVHTAEFKADERQYLFYREAEAWLKRNNVARDWD